MISQRAIDLIIEAEVTSRVMYEKKYRLPEWPGGASGVTIGIGYDLGYVTLPKLHEDWQGRVHESMLRVMTRCLGVRGEAAKRLLPTARGTIDIPWDDAMAVFLSRDIPAWEDRVCLYIPAARRLSADSRGALVSLAYNRGASFDAVGERYTEMRRIKAHIVNDDLRAVESEFRSMKRLWPDMRGLRLRRDAEADLWTDGLQVSANKPPVKYRPQETPQTFLPPDTTISTRIAGTTAVVTTAAPHTTGMSTTATLWATALGLALALALYLVLKSSTPTTARQKDQQDA